MLQAITVSSCVAGDHCELDIDECAEGICEFGASCENFNGTYECNCTYGYEGVNCDAANCRLVCDVKQSKFQRPASHDVYNRPSYHTVTYTSYMSSWRVQLLAPDTRLLQPVNLTSGFSSLST